jgi:hypothetical protein
LVFSFDPPCQGEWGSQKQMDTPVATEIERWSAIITMSGILPRFSSWP